MLRFTKMNGAGNDFILIDNRAGDIHLNRTQIARLCDRHRGIGADGILLLENPSDHADFRMRYFNADGGEAEMCGNGARCFARFANKAAGAKDKISFETPAGVISAEFVVVPVAQVGDVDVSREGSAIRYHEMFSPKGANVNFIEKRGVDKVAVRTYERGVEDETLACGTGVVASALVFAVTENVKGPITVIARGGDELRVGFDRIDKQFRNVTLTGPAEFAFEGTIEI
ncbi:MAG: diaminopimelate epimerase [Verrucomicrobia bacterium 13_1_20CM_4_54_11]|nr:MAG: diaminopimelate epimerase [Verrucomicrobia bacterium 13_1_20CM_4_54_11]